GLDAAVYVVEQLARACASTAMVVTMHYAGTAVIEAYGAADVRSAIASGSHLTTLAFSERGSRSHFWAPLSTATATAAGVELDADKSWVTAAGEADSYVWSSRPVAADGPMTLWFGPAAPAGLAGDGTYDGIGLRGNASCPMTARGAVIPGDAMLGADGAGLDIALAAVLPWFLLCNAAGSLGLMEVAVATIVERLGSTRLEHLDATFAADPR